MKLKTTDHIKLMAEAVKRVSPHAPIITTMKRRYREIVNGTETEVDGPQANAHYKTYEEAKAAGVTFDL